MARTAPKNTMDKFKRYRARQKARGMKLVRIWVPDPNAPGFKAEARRQARVLRSAPEQKEALDFIEANFDDRDWTW